MPKDWRKAKVTCIFKKHKEEDLGNYRLVSLTSILGNVMEQLILQIICRHIKEETITRSSQHGFTKGRSCLTNLINFCDEVTGPIGEERAEYVVYLEFSNAFDSVFGKILIDEFGTYRLEMQKVRLTKN